MSAAGGRAQASAQNTAGDAALAAEAQRLATELDKVRQEAEGWRHSWQEERDRAAGLYMYQQQQRMMHMHHHHHQMMMMGGAPPSAHVPSGEHGQPGMLPPVHAEGPHAYGGMPGMPRIPVPQPYGLPPGVPPPGMQQLPPHLQHFAPAAQQPGAPAKYDQPGLNGVPAAQHLPPQQALPRVQPRGGRSHSRARGRRKPPAARRPPPAARLTRERASAGCRGRRRHCHDPARLCGRCCRRRGVAGRLWGAAGANGRAGWRASPTAAPCCRADGGAGAVGHSRHRRDAAHSRADAHSRAARAAGPCAGATAGRDARGGGSCGAEARVASSQKGASPPPQPPGSGGPALAARGVHNRLPPWPQAFAHTPSLR